MDIEFDRAKRDRTLAERGLDFADAAEVFAGTVITAADERRDYGELRFITVGTLNGRTVVLVWTPQIAARRIISMRYANAREIKRYAHFLG